MYYAGQNRQSMLCKVANLETALIIQRPIPEIATARVGALSDRGRSLAGVLGFVGRFRATRFFVDANSQGAEKIQILGSKRSSTRGIRGQRLGWFRRGFIEPDGRFQHQHDLKTFRADVAYHSCNLVGFSYGLVDGFAKLLNKVAYLAIQIQPPRAGTVAFFLPYFGFDKRAMS